MPDVDLMRLAQAILAPTLAALTRMEGSGHPYHPYRDGGPVNSRAPAASNRGRLLAGSHQKAPV